MDKPRVLQVRKFELHEREPPNEKEFFFVEANPPVDLREKGFFEKIRNLFGF